MKLALVYAFLAVMLGILLSPFILTVWVAFNQD